MATFYVDTASVDFLSVTGSMNITSQVIVTGSFISTTGFTGSLLGTASSATTVNSNATASYILASNVYGLYGANSIVSSSTTTTAGYTPTSTTSTFTRRESTTAFIALGSSIVAEAFDLHLHRTYNPLALTDGQLYLAAVYLDTGRTITGVKYIGSTAGVFTADNYNGFALYSYSGGTLTLQATSSNDSNMWKTAAISGMISKSFSTTYSAAAGTYFIGALYNSSAQTTQPSLMGGVALASNGLVGIDFTNSAKFVALLNSQTTPPASIAMSSTTGGNNLIYLALY